MTVTTALFGSLSGLFIGVYSNGVRKLPLLRKPWEHLVLMGFMGYLGHQYPGIEDATLARVNGMRDAEEAEAWYTMAAAQGHPGAEVRDSKTRFSC